MEEAKAVLDGMGPLPDNWRRLRYLVDVLSGNEVAGQEEWLAPKVIETYFEGNTVEFTKELRSLVGGQLNQVGAFHLNDFCAAVAGKLEADIIEEKSLNDVISTMWYYEVEFLYKVMTYHSTVHEGAAKRLIRNFAERCVLQFLVHKITVTRINDPDKELLAALCDGYNKRVGSDKVAHLHITESVKVESSFKDNCRITNPSRALLRKREELRDKFIELTSAEHVKAWMEEHFPHLVVSE